MVPDLAPVLGTIGGSSGDVADWGGAEATTYLEPILPYQIQAVNFLIFKCVNFFPLKRSQKSAILFEPS